MTIEEARKKIDELDQQIVDLFYERMNTSCEIAKVKAAEGLDIYNPVREREILDKLAAQHEDMELYTSRLYRTIFELSRGYQRQFVKAPAKIREQIEQLRGHRELGLPERATVACQGVEGAYAQMAADRLFKRGSLMYMKNFEAVFDAVDKGLCQFGVLPIDNSTNGSVKQVYDLMAEKKFYIVASTQLFIKHELLAKKGTKRPKKQRKPKVEYTPYEEIHDEPEVPRSDEEYNRKKAETERDIDAILDKIAHSGYGSLTAEEKEFLFKNSR